MLSVQPVRAHGRDQDEGLLCQGSKLLVGHPECLDVWRREVSEGSYTEIVVPMATRVAIRTGLSAVGVHRFHLLPDLLKLAGGAPGDRPLEVGRQVRGDVLDRILAGVAYGSTHVSLLPVSWV